MRSAARRCGCTPRVHRDEGRASGALHRARSRPTGARVSRAGRGPPGSPRTHTFDGPSNWDRSLGICTSTRPGSPCYTSSTRRDRTRGPRCRSGGSDAARPRRSAAAVPHAARARSRGTSRDARARRCAVTSSPECDAHTWTAARTPAPEGMMRSRYALTRRRPAACGGCARGLSAVSARLARRLLPGEHLGPARQEPDVRVGRRRLHQGRQVPGRAVSYRARSQNRFSRRSPSVGDVDAGCAGKWPSAGLNLDADPTNLRGFQQVQRFGHNYLWPRERQGEPAMVQGLPGPAPPSHPRVARDAREGPRVVRHCEGRSMMRTHERRPVEGLDQYGP